MAVSFREGKAGNPDIPALPQRHFGNGISSTGSGATGAGVTAGATGGVTGGTVAAASGATGWAGRAGGASRGSG